MIRNKVSLSEQWRVFCAIELPFGLRQRAMAHISQLQSSVPDARATWNRIETLHLTLKFLGEIPTTRVEALSFAARNAAHSVKPFDLVVAGCGSFPPHGLPRVLWIGIEDPKGGLAQLYRSLEAECAAAGFPCERRGFHAHITLARLRTRDDGARHVARCHRELGFEAAPFNVNALVVMRSILEARGSHYLPLTQCAFASSTADAVEGF